MDSLTAKANVGAGTDQLAGVETVDGFVGAVALADSTGALHTAGNPVPVQIQGSIPVTVASALEITNDAGSPIPVSAAAMPLPAGAATDATIEAVNSLLNEIAVRLCDIADSVGNLSPDVSGRIRVAAESVANIATITTVTTVGTVTTMTQIGAVPAVQAMYAFTQMNEYCLRQNVVIS